MRGYAKEEALHVGPKNDRQNRIRTTNRKGQNIGNSHPPPHKHDSKSRSKKKVTTWEEVIEEFVEEWRKEGDEQWKVDTRVSVLHSQKQDQCQNNPNEKDNEGHFPLGNVEKMRKRGMQQTYL